MKILSLYIGNIKANPRSHTVFALAAITAVTLRIMGLLLYFTAPTVWELAVFFMCPFLSMALFWLPVRSPLRSPFWLYKLIGIAVFVSMGYDASVEYIRTSAYYAPHPLLPWLRIWLKPFAVCAGFLLIHRVFSYLADSGMRVFKLYRAALMSAQPFFTSQNGERRLTKRNKLTLILGCALMAISALFLLTTLFLHFHFPSMDAEAIIFTVKYANDGYSPAVARKLIVYGVLAVAAATVLSIRLIRFSRAETVSFSTPDKSASHTMNARAVRAAVWILIPVLSVTVLFRETHTFDYIKHLIQKSEIYENYYVVPDAETVTFPGKKKNLIYIYLESFENSYTTPENGGLQSRDFMPELTGLAKENISFSNGEQLGGSVAWAPSIAYTMGATVAQTSGVLLMTPLGKMRNKMGELNSFLPSLRRLEDILHDNGYEQLFIEGSDSSFAAYNSYVGRYENSRVFDLNSARSEGLIPEDYFEMWGFEDRKMFEFSKMKIDALAESGKPFAVTMYTMDTHSYEEGYRCPLCDPSEGNNFIAAVGCTSRQVADFMSWLKTRPYYEDTVVVITGDHIAEHLTKGIEFEAEGYVRTPYNCFINAAKEPVNPKNRTFSPLDMFPTTLSAMGAEIKGGRLALGTDLFSDKPTLCEELGTEEFLEQLQSRSDYFNREFW